MAAGCERSLRVAAVLQREVAALIREETRAAEASGACVTHVAVSRDFSLAKIFVVVPDGDDPAQTAAALNHIAAFLQRRLRARVRLKRLPRLHFAPDPAPARGERIESLLRRERARA